MPNVPEQPHYTEHELSTEAGFTHLAQAGHVLAVALDEVAGILQLLRDVVGAAATDLQATC